MHEAGADWPDQSLASMLAKRVDNENGATFFVPAYCPIPPFDWRGVDIGSQFAKEHGLDFDLCNAMASTLRPIAVVPIETLKLHFHYTFVYTFDPCCCNLTPGPRVRRARRDGGRRPHPRRPGR